MNKKVLQTTIYLLWLFLLAFAIVKLFFGEWFSIQITNQKIIAIGKVIDENKWLKLTIDCIVSLLTAHFYLCAGVQKWALKWWQYLIILGLSVGVNFLYLWNANIATEINLIIMIAMPFLLGANYLSFVAVFLAHYLGQIAILFIRSEPLYLVDTNYATQFILLFDMHIWLALYYVYSNKYKGEIEVWEKHLYRCLEIKPTTKSKKKSNASTKKSKD